MITYFYTSNVSLFTCCRNDWICELSRLCCVLDRTQATCNFPSKEKIKLLNCCVHRNFGKHSTYCIYSIWHQLWIDVPENWSVTRGMVSSFWTVFLVDWRDVSLDNSGTAPMITFIGDGCINARANTGTSIWIFLLFRRLTDTKRPLVKSMRNTSNSFISASIDFHMKSCTSIIVLTFSRWHNIKTVMSRPLVLRVFIAV